MSFFKNLFKQRGIKDVVTLFHDPSSAASVRVHTFLKQASAQQSATATLDQASEHPVQGKEGRTEYELDVQEAKPTGDQLNSILEYLGPNAADTVVEGATGASDALKLFKQDEVVLKRPIVVDWNNGRAVVGEDQSQILALLKALPKE